MKTASDNITPIIAAEDGENYLIFEVFEGFLSNEYKLIEKFETLEELNKEAKNLYGVTFLTTEIECV